MIGESLGHYQILELLGLGGMGRVYRGYDTTLERDVAIKLLPDELADDPDRLARLEREAKLLAALNHPNVATIHSLEEVAGIRFLVMELVEGETLAGRLAQGPLAIMDCLEISCQIAHGLQAAHDRGILHRDLKPANVMVSDQGSVKVLDFGVARPLHALEGSTALTEARTQEASLTGAGTLLGTAPYMSPEQVRGQVLDKRSDIWAFGCVLYEMLTGEHTFARKTMPDTWAAVLEHEPDWSKLPAQTPESIRGLLARCLQKEPDRRLRDIGDARLEIEPELDSMRRSGDVPRVVTPRSRPRLAAGLGLAAILLGVVAVFGPIYIWPPGDQASGGAAAAALDPAQWVIAVVPVTTGAADDKELTALNEGLALTLTGRLSQLSRGRGLQIIPASMLREEGIDSLEEARIVLGVTLAIGFATRQVGDRIRVNANLIDVPSRRQLDGDTIEASADNLIDLEERVTVAVLRMLRVELLPTERQSFDIGTRDARAYDLFLRGQGYLGFFNEPANVEAAIDLFEKALAADSTYARARAGLGEAFWRHYGHTNERRWIDRATEECRRAVQLDELEPMGHVCLGTLYEGTGRPELAVGEFAQATGLDPNLDAAYRGLAEAYEAQAKIELAEATYEEAIRARPHYWAGHSWLAKFYLRQGRFGESITSFEEVIRLAPDGYGGYSNVGVAYYHAERWNDAESAFQQALEINPEDQVALSNLGTLQFFLGRYGEAARTFERARALDDTDYWIWGNLADAYYWAAGERDKAAPAYRNAIVLGVEKLKVNALDTDVLIEVAFYHAMIGEGAAARQYMNRALALAPTAVDVQLVAAQVEQRLGDVDASLDYLEAAVAAGYQLTEIRADPVFAELAGNARFEALTAQRP